MADLAKIREQVRNELTPVYDQQAATIQGAGDKQVAGYTDYSNSVASRYQQELDSLNAQEAETTKNELGRVEAGAAAAGAQGGVVTANRLMTTSQIGKDYTGKRTAAKTANEDTLAKIRQLIASTQADTAEKLAGIKATAAGAIESTATGRYNAAAAAEQAAADERFRQAQLAEQKRQFNTSTAISNSKTAQAEKDAFEKNKANFEVASRQALSLLSNPDPKKRISWGDAFWMVKKAVPDATNADIDAILNKEFWSKPGAYNVWKSNKNKSGAGGGGGGGGGGGY